MRGELRERDNDVWPFPLPAGPAALPIRPWIKGAWVSAQAEESLQTSWGRAPPWQENSREGEGDGLGLPELQLTSAYVHTYVCVHIHTLVTSPELRASSATWQLYALHRTPSISWCCKPHLSIWADSNTSQE